MKTIWKIPIDDASGEPITAILPYNSRILCVQLQRGVPCMWAMVDDEEPLVERTFAIYGTGHTMSPEGSSNYHQYIGTYQIKDGREVYHLFEVRRIPVCD